MDIEHGGTDFNTLVRYLDAELKASDAATRAVALASQRSFAKWSRDVLERAASKLGLTLGFLAGWVGEAYQVVSGGFRDGWREGLDKGRGN